MAKYATQGNVQMPLRRPFQGLEVLTHKSSVEISHQIFGFLPAFQWNHRINTNIHQRSLNINQTTRMPYSSSSSSVRVTKNPGHFSSCCISQTWSYGFLKNFKQYFSPPDFDISWKLSDLLGGSGGWVRLPAWVSRPERPKGVKDEVGARRAPN